MRIPVLHLVCKIQVVMNGIGWVHDLYLITKQMLVQHVCGKQADSCTVLDGLKHTVQIWHDVCRMHLWTLLKMLSPIAADDW
ncbi:hypothetical protein D3C78_1423600 [compost metagenome]